MDEVVRQRLADGEACHEAALRYLEMGWSVLALCPPDHVGVGLVNRKHTKECKNHGKVPWHTWKEFMSRLPTIEEVGNFWHQLPNSNVGIALGPISGMVRVDVEGEGGEALLFAKSGGDLPATLEFSSGRTDSKGYGLLYAIPEGVTIRTTYEPVEKKQELRFQAKGAQTVLPPSRHESGSLYTWSPSKAPGQIEVAKMPAWLVSEMAATTGKFSSRAAHDWDALFAGVAEGSRNSSMAAIIGKMLYNLRDLDDSSVRDVWRAAVAINESNDPPMEDAELKTIFSSVLRKERARRAEESDAELEKLIEKDVIASTTPAPQPSKNGHVEPESLPDWDLIVIDSSPPLYDLRAPFWSDKPKVRDGGGYIRCTVKQIINWNSVRVQAMSQADCCPPMHKGWNKILQKLIDVAKHKTAPMESKRHLVVAEFLLALIQNAKDVRLDPVTQAANYGNGWPINLPAPDDRIAIKLKWLLQQAAFDSDDIQRGELLEAMTMYKMESIQLGDANKRSRWWVITPADLVDLKTDVLAGAKP